MSDNPDNLPAALTVSIDVDIPETQEFPVNVAESTLREDDLKYATTQLHVLSSLWGQELTIPNVLRLLRETREVVKFRRDVLGIPYGYHNQSSKGNDFTPLD